MVKDNFLHVKTERNNVERDLVFNPFQRGVPASTDSRRCKSDLWPSARTWKICARFNFARWGLWTRELSTYVCTFGSTRWALKRQCRYSRQHGQSMTVQNEVSMSSHSYFVSTENPLWALTVIYSTGCDKLHSTIQQSTGAQVVTRENQVQKHTNYSVA